jgi:MerR family copper efflux transcriptional regulator
MRIGDAAAAAGTTPRALRFYEQRGLLPPPPRTANGQRWYGEGDLARVRVVRKLLSLGLTVEDVRRSAGRLELLDGETLPPYGSAGCDKSTGTVQNRIAALDAEIARLVRIRDGLIAAVTPGESSASSTSRPCG